MPSIQDEKIHFQAPKDSLRIMLAQISPVYDPDLLTKEGLVKVRDGDKQAQKILKVIEHFLSTEADMLLFPELVAPFSHLTAFEDALKETDKDFVVNICYEHTHLRDLISTLSEEEIEEHGFLAKKVEMKQVNFCRILMKVGHELKVFTQIKLTSFSSEFSLSLKDTLLRGKIVHRFITNWGNFLFLICEDYMGEVRMKKRRIPMFDFLKSLTAEGLHYVFVSALNTEAEAFIHAARAFYYMQEKSGRTFTLFLNTAELNHTTVVFPARPHPKIRTTEEIEIIPLFESKPGWGTQLKFSGCKEIVITGTFVRLDRYTSMPSKEIFSPVYQTDILHLSQLGIESEVLETREKSVTEEKILARPLHNLPSQTTPFVGREIELAEIAKLLAHPSCRLLTLLGPGGIGKTRLALQAAAEKIEVFPHGVYWIPLAPLSSANFLVSTVADSLRFSFYGRENPKTQLLNYLREKEMLLVMDNFEHLLEGAGLLAEILENAPKVKTLVTSRERLNVRGEWITEVRGMRFPASESTNGLEGYSAVQLFLQTAQRVRPGFILSAEEKPHVIRICQLVEGMPLGIELASSWMRILSCEDVVKELEHSLDFLATSMRDVPERHRSMRVVFEHSWNLLSEEEKEVFMKLSVFRGGFQRDASEKVAGASLSMLSSLVDRSLLRWNPSERYEMHELLRHYAEEKLAEVSGRKQKVQDLHCGYHAEFLHQRRELLRGKKQKQILKEIGEEIENVRIGWNWAVQHGKVGVLDKSLESLFRFYVVRSWFQEGEEMFRKGVEKLEEPGGMDEIAGEKVQVLGKILARQGVFQMALAAHGYGGELLQKSLDIFRRLDVRREMAFALRNLGQVAFRLGRYTKARQLLQESLSICTETGDRVGIASSLNNLGHVAYHLGECEEAKRLYHESLVLGREIGDQHGMAKYLLNLGNVAHRLGEDEEAKKLYEESLSICEDIGDQLGRASAFNNLGLVSYSLGQYEEAEQLYQRSLEIKKEVGDRRAMAVSLGNLGNVAYELEKYGEAKKFHQEVLVICREIGSRQITAGALNGLGHAAYALGEYQESEENFREALKTAMEIHAAPIALATLVGIATLLAKEGDKARALELIALILSHPATWKDALDKAERLRSELVSRLTSKAVAAAEERGKTMSLEQVAEEILGGKEKDTKGSHTRDRKE